MSDEVEETEEGSEKPKASLTKNLNTIIIVVVVAVVGFFAYMYMGEAVDQNAQDQALDSRRNEEKEKRTFQENEVKRLAMLEKAAADREAEQRKLQMAQEAQKLEYENKKKAQRDEFNNTRAQAAARKLAQLKNLIQSDLSKFETELLKVDNEMTANYLKISRVATDTANARAAAEVQIRKERQKLEELQKDDSAEFDKARASAAAAKNQAEYSAKKIEEANLQMREYQKKPQGNTELIAKLNSKIESLRREQTTHQANAAKAETFVISETNRREGEMARLRSEGERRISELSKASVDIETSRAQQAVKDLTARREKLLRIMKEKVLELTQLRLDPDYAELSKLGADIDIQKTLDQMNGLISSLPPKPPAPPVPGRPVVADTPAPGTNPATPVNPTTAPANGGSPTTSDTGVTVSAKKEKVTVYTLKDGKTVTATKSVDAGDMLSVKTLEGKFQSIFKEDIVKEESKEQ